MLLVPAGVFTMGSASGGEEDERPPHAVRLPAFWLDRTEVTLSAYQQCMAAKICAAPKKPQVGPNKPVRYVAWADASAYCAWRGARLPREAEFERAIRGDDGRAFPWGNDPPNHERAVFATRGPEDVGSRPSGRGPFGHEDLAGNVWEWMEDEYDPYAYRRSGAAEGRPGSCAEIGAAQDELRRQHKQGFTGSNAIPTECERSIRGGAYNYMASGLRASNRVHHAASYRLPVLGFRCAKSAPAGQPTAGVE